MVAHTHPKILSVHKPTIYSHVTRAGNLLFIAGQVSLDKAGKLVGKGDIELQARQAFANLQSILKECGATLQHIAKLNVYLTHSAFIEPYRKVRAQLIVEPFPASTLVIVESLASPEWLIEVEATAVLDEAPAPAVKR